MQPKPPFSVRNSPEKLEDFFVLREGLPDWLKRPMWSFLASTVSVYGPMGRQISPVFIDMLAGLTGHSLPQDSQDLVSVLSGNDELLLDAVDYAMAWTREEPIWKHVQDLNTHLDNARSIYTIGRDDSGRYEIQYRQPPELTQIVEEATSRRDRSARHLQEAWSNAFKRDANLNAAGAAAVKAVEVAAKPVIIPDNNKATLGQIISAMRDKAEKWETDSEADGGIEAITDMMDQIWKGHHRHGDETKPFEASAAGTQMIVHLAVLLVHWFNEGKIRTV